MMPKIGGGITAGEDLRQARADRGVDHRAGHDAEEGGDDEPPQRHIEEGRDQVGDEETAAPGASSRIRNSIDHWFSSMARP